MNRIPSDHPSIESVRGHVARHGGGRRRIELPRGILPKDDEIIRVVIDEEVLFGGIVINSGDEPDWLTGVYSSPRLARSRDGTDQLGEWLDNHDRSAGSSVHVDTITEQYAIGLRVPGDRIFYPSLQSPGSSLDAIARSLDES